METALRLLVMSENICVRDNNWLQKVGSGTCV